MSVLSRRGPVAVIGGGFAGLAAATMLSDAGVAVHLFEARPTLGGRANTFRDPVTRERIDNGQHVLAGCYTETLAFLRRVGSIACLHRPATLRVPTIDAHGRRTELVLPPVPAPFHLLGGVLGWEALTWTDRWSLLRLGPALRGERKVLAGETVREWLDRHHQTPKVCQLLWEPLALAALNQSIDQASAQMFVAVTSRMFGADADAAALLVPAVPLDDLYVRPATRYLSARGAHIRSHAKARVVFEGQRAIGVQDGSECLAVSAVISAVPWFAAAAVFPDPPSSIEPLLKDAAALGSAPIVTVNLWLDGFESDDVMVGLPGRTFQWVFDRRRVIGPEQTHLSLVSSGADAICAMPNDELIALAADELRQAIPAMAEAPLRHASVVRERRATFTLTPGGPLRPETVTPVGGLFFAGDWIDTGLPATIESAVMSGHRAAAAVLETLS